MRCDRTESGEGGPSEDTYKDRFLSHQYRRHEVRYPGINLAQITGLPADASATRGRAGAGDAKTLLTFRRCSAHRSAFVNCPDIVLTFPAGEDVMGGGTGSSIKRQANVCVRGEMGEMQLTDRV